jgi:hypothetical protein
MTSSHLFARPVCQAVMSKIAAQPAGSVKVMLFGTLSWGSALFRVASVPS